MELGLGPALKSLRQEKQLSLREAARRAGVSHPYLSQLENGKNDKPSLEIMDRLAKTYDITLDELMSKAYIKNVWVGFVDSPEYKKIEEDIAIDNEMKKKKDILHFLQNKEDNVYYNGRMLSPEEREKVLTVLKAILE